MTNNAQLLPLPVPEYRLSPDSKPSLYDADQIQSYALACIEAAKPTQTCNYPDCKCPTENPCLKGLPADALGSLPVVAKVKIEDGTWMNVYEPDFTMMSDGMHSLTDHAQATAEIAKRDGALLMLADANKRLADEKATLRAKLAGVDGLVEALRSAIRISIELVFMAEIGREPTDIEVERALSKTTPDSPVGKLLAILATYEAAQGANDDRQ